MTHPFVMNLISHMFNTSVIPYLSLDQYLNPNLYTIPNMQNMRFFCCSVYIVLVYKTYVEIQINYNETPLHLSSLEVSGSFLRLKQQS